MAISQEFPFALSLKAASRSCVNPELPAQLESLSKPTQGHRRCWNLVHLLSGGQRSPGRGSVGICTCAYRCLSYAYIHTLRHAHTYTRAHQGSRWLWGKILFPNRVLHLLAPGAGRLHPHGSPSSPGEALHEFPGEGAGGGAEACRSRLAPWLEEPTVPTGGVCPPCSRTALPEFSLG